MSSRFRVPGWAADPYLWLALLLALPVVSPLLQPGYHWGAHDARHSVYFLFQFDKAIQDGIWYPRWSPDFAFGFGYPFFNIYGPLSSYAGEVFVRAGFGYTGAVKMVFGLSAVLSGLTMYLFARRLLGSQGGLVAGLGYVYFPYHLFDLYVRAALAESVGYVFIPLVLWAFFEAAAHPTVRRVLWGGAAYAGLMLTHNAVALMLTPILGLYVLLMLVWNDGRRRTLPGLARRAAPPAAVLLLGLGLSAIFLLPAVAETKYVRVDQWVGGRYAFGEDFVELFQLFSPRWGFGASIPGPNDDAGFQIGLVPVVLFVLSFGAAPRLKRREQRLTLYFFQGMAAVIAFLTTPLSGWVWAAAPLSRFAQFPWRLLVLIAPAIAVAGGTVVARLKQTGRAAAAAVLPLALLIMLAGFPYLKADLRDPKPTEGPVDLAGLFRFQQSADEMTGSTVWVKKIPT
ncbi:MAG: glycosyltransferase family 39 protein, partial [Anaerolineae bacterium]